MKGRIVLTPALVLSTGPHREFDRICLLYTPDFGKVPVRFVGADRPAAKLRGMAEPLVHAEFRLHVREGGEFAVATGGSIVSAYPALRSRLGSLLRGLEVCELLESLTPSWNPVPKEYELAVECLDEMEERVAATGSGAMSGELSGALSWGLISFTLRLMHAAGFSLHGRKVAPEHQAAWDLLHRGDFSEAMALPPDPARQRRLELFTRRAVETVLQAPLPCAHVAEKLAV